MENHSFQIDNINLKLLVSVHRSILLVDVQNQQVTTFYEGPNKDSLSPTESHYGITWNEENIFVVDTMKNDAPRNRITRLTPTGDFNGFFVSPRHPMGEVHQIFYCPDDNQIFITDTANNLLRIVAPSPNHEKDWWDIAPTDYMFTDHNHFNGVWIEKNSLYVIAHNRENPSEIFKLGHYLDTRFKINNRRKWQQGQGDAHNIVRYKGELVVLSTDGTIYGQGNKPVLYTKPFEPLRWARGLVLTDDYFVVGQSLRKLVKVDRTNPMNEGKLEIFNSHDLSHVGTIVLDNIGQVYDVRCLNQKDHAHNRIVLWDDQSWNKYSI